MTPIVAAPDPTSRADPGHRLAERRVLAPRPLTPPSATSRPYPDGHGGLLYTSTSISLTVAITVRDHHLCRYEVYPESTSICIDHVEPLHLQFEDAALLKLAILANEAVHALRHARGARGIDPATA
ncbi:MAG TPA: hypothetical protein VGD84_24965 [Pseudonocardiaceae bacterium]